MVKRGDISALQRLQEYVALVVVDADQYQNANVRIIKEVIRNEVPGVYVTLSKPYQTIKSLFHAAKIDTSRVIFIDAVSKTAGGTAERKRDCLFIGNPRNLSDISIAMDQAVTAIPAGDKFLFFDSLSTLLLYNSASMVAKFIHFLSVKMRVWKVKGIIISLRRQRDKELIEVLQEYCDVILQL